MWRLKIIQKRGQYDLDYEVQFESEDLNDLTLMAIRLANFKNGKNTRFEIEYVEEKNECSLEN